MNIYNIPIGCDFLQELGNFIFNTFSNIDSLTVFLPNRRSCNEMKRKLFEIKKEEVLFLPTIKAISDIDYNDFIIGKDSSLLSSSKIKYKSLLVRELAEWGYKSDIALFKNTCMKQICGFASELEEFLNEVVENQIDIDKLMGVVSDEFAKKWQETLQFLHVFCVQWISYKKNNNIISIAEHRTNVLEENASYFKNNKPKNPIIIAGFATNIKSANDFVKSLLAHDNCYFIFNGLDKTIDNPDIAHSQYLLHKIWKNTLNNKNIKEIGAPCDNFKILQYSMLPSHMVGVWKNNIDIKQPSNIIKVECKNNTDELQFIIAAIQNNKDKTIAITTTDETFAKQIEVSLKNNNFPVYNAFGNKYSRKESIKYLFLILDAIKSDFSCIPLLSLLKHRFTNLDSDNYLYAKYMIELEDKYLREGKNLSDFNNKITDKILNICNLNANRNFKDILKEHIDIAAKITNTNIFNDDDVCVFLNEIINECCDYKIKDLTEYSCLLDFLIAENSYNEKYEIHPLVTIIKPNEARLLNFDLVIVANCNETRFPANISNNIWMNKSMRRELGLPDYDEQIGVFAFDWMQLLSQKKVYITRAIKENNLLTTKSRFLTRLEIFLKSQKTELKNYKMVGIEYDKNVFEIDRPNPKPNISIRPKKISATDIEKLINNPYDIYAKKILFLKRKKDLWDNNDYIIFGNAVHAAIDEYTKNYNYIIGNKIDYMIDNGKHIFSNFFIDKNKERLFFIRFNEIAKWFIKQDEKIRENGYKIISETEHYINIDDVKISAKIDRIEYNDNIVNICDYKTGTVPSKNEVARLEKPQLIIEAIILNENGDNINKLYYWQVKGGDEEENKNKITDITEEAEEVKNLIKKGKINLQKIIKYFNKQENGYTATLHELNKKENFESDYKHLSRVDEWGYY
ncbi:MAG: PD-(D/E)XK nuclease family protein [Rickettsiales bacterium]|jgi:ATP-dependent helicase/nuclease subunit B|nr:PD-(D/E)XK nuclease family protein [Rickettsiales bacterium]